MYFNSVENVFPNLIGEKNRKFSRFPFLVRTVSIIYCMFFQSWDFIIVTEEKESCSACLPLFNIFLNADKDYPNLSSDYMSTVVC